MYDVNVCGECMYDRLYSWDEPCKICSELRSWNTESYFREGVTYEKNLEKDREKNED